jgi:phenylpropionate dioxygenase-like ring-hydroxylating dioxygenase large terminal subunit
MNNIEETNFADIASKLDEGLAVPLKWYYDPEIADFEAKMFERSWQYVGHAGQLTDTGQFITSKVGRVPIIVVRNRAGELRAFRNVCRHRAAEVVTEPCGQRRTLQCHYHAWTYNLDGDLVGAPRSDRESGFDRSQLSLVSVGVANWGPFVFVNLDPECTPLSAALGNVPDLVHSAGVDVEDLVFSRRSEYDMECNWKVSIENYLECYHCPGAHPGFSRVLDTTADAYQISTTETHAYQTAPLRRPTANDVSNSSTYSGRDGVVNTGLYIAVWPSLTININPGLPNLSIGPMLPNGIDRAHALLDYFFHADVTNEWIENMLVFDDCVAAEDQTLIESVQRGVMSQTFDRGHILPKSEALLIGFQRYLVGQHQETIGINAR